MVYVDDRKFACESCIKGHRSSTCHHADRPLFEIKKKGRPVSQCEKCRQLRQSKKVHTKCICNPKFDQSQQRIPLASNGTKSKRYMPVVPSLPNGLKDLIQESASSGDCPQPRVDSLLNPSCDFCDSSQCECQDPSEQLPSSLCVDSDENLGALATAAVICCNKTGKNLNLSVIASTSASEIRPGFQLLPPIQNSSQDSSAHTNVPDFSIIPPLSTIASLAGSGCTCGFRCACPGCLEHRGPEYASSSHRDCADGCGSCIDEQSVVLSGSQKPDSTSLLDRFFAHAAALPPPPRRKGGGIYLDPVDITVYPDSAWGSEESAVAFGLVHLPKLECCGGRCGCPDSRCGCGTACDGACSKDINSRTKCKT
ncbi:copper fist DNA binding domain-containing protein [Amanita rubescens]|nr:copper fist DNA binding domain-containing protein [Amanita rubescens]